MHLFPKKHYFAKKFRCLPKNSLHKTFLTKKTEFVQKSIQTVFFGKRKTDVCTKITSKSIPRKFIIVHSQKLEREESNDNNKELN